MDAISKFEKTESFSFEKAKVLQVAPKRIDPHHRPTAMAALARRAAENRGIFCLYIVDAKDGQSGYTRYEISKRVPDGYRFCWYVTAELDSRDVVQVEVWEYVD